MFRFALPVAALLVIGAAPSGSSNHQAELDRALAGFTAGEEVACVRPADVSQMRTFPDTILYDKGRNTIWRNTPTQGCSLGKGDIVVSINPKGRFCAGDVIQTRRPVGGTITGSCALNKFVTYTRAASK